MTTGTASHLHLLTFQECDPPQRRLMDSTSSVPLRNRRERHHWRERLEATAWPGRCTDLVGVPLIVKLASESVDTVEERQGLPSEEAQKRHTAHQAFQFHSSDTSTLKKKKKNIGALCECNQNVTR